MFFNFSIIGVFLLETVELKIFKYLDLIDFEFCDIIIKDMRKIKFRIKKFFSLIFFCRKKNIKIDIKKIK